MNQRIYKIGFFILLLAVIIIPLCFSLFKFAKNPSEFKKESKRYAKIEALATVPKSVSDRMKVGDIQYDQNGEEMVKLLSLSDPQPHVTGHASFNGGNYVDIVEPSSEDRTAIFEVRYNKVGDCLYTHSSGIPMGLNYLIVFSTKDYTVNCHITKIIKVDGDVAKGRR